MSLCGAGPAAEKCAALFALFAGQDRHSAPSSGIRGRRGGRHVRAGSSPSGSRAGAGFVAGAGRWHGLPGSTGRTKPTGAVWAGAGKHRLGASGARHTTVLVENPLLMTRLWMDRSRPRVWRPSSLTNMPSSRIQEESTRRVAAPFPGAQRVSGEPRAMASDQSKWISACFNAPVTRPNPSKSRSLTTQVWIVGVRALLGGLPSPAGRGRAKRDINPASFGREV